jgi:hypothetical protein
MAAAERREALSSVARVLKHATLPAFAPRLPSDCHQTTMKER